MEIAPSAQIVKKQNCMTEISEFLPFSQTLDWNLFNHHFYDNLVPMIHRNRKLNPVIHQKVHLFLKDKAVYGITLNDTHTVRAIDFEEDEWRHDCQCKVEEKLKLMFNLDSFEQVKKDEEILPHYIIQLTSNKFLAFPLREAVFLTRGLIIEITKEEGAKIIKECA